MRLFVGEVNVFVCGGSNEIVGEVNGIVCEESKWGCL